MAAREPTAPLWLPDARFGGAEDPLPAVEDQDDLDPDDEELDETPPDVIAMLGFDPKTADEPGKDPGEDPDA